MSLLLGSLSEPLTSCIRGFNRAIKAGGFTWGDTVVIQGTGPIGILAIAAAQEMGAGALSLSGRRAASSREFSAEAPSTSRRTGRRMRIRAVRDIVGGWGATW
jgi:threonine dehydrogenase-like Zn-dependent dehydrogenase